MLIKYKMKMLFKTLHFRLSCIFADVKKLPVLIMIFTCILNGIRLIPWHNYFFLFFFKITLKGRSCNVYEWKGLFLTEVAGV